MLHRVWKTGHVVIAKEIRDQLGIKPGWIAVQRVVDDRLEISLMPPEAEQSSAPVEAVPAAADPDHRAPGEGP
jgi:bifunctional DNA-binding transcriptional regulator/antitoxin component of YhaV-PrlF toxin-antitoxin module